MSCGAPLGDYGTPLFPYPDVNLILTAQNPAELKTEVRSSRDLCSPPFPPSSGIPPDYIYTDHGLTGTTRARPGLAQALAAVRQGDTLVVSQAGPSDPLGARRPRHRRPDQHQGRETCPGADGPATADPMGKMFFNILATFAEFEADLIRMRTREGMAVTRAKGKLLGRQPKLSIRQSRELRRMYDTDDYSISALADIFGVSRATIYRTLERTES